MKMCLGVLVVALCLSTALAAFGQERFVKPVDEASKEASFLAFRTKLIAAAERRDAAFILSIVDPQIKLSFGGDEGIADFKRIWKLNAKNSQFWDEFLKVVKNGGSFDGEGRNKLASFTAPYTFGSWPDDVDAFEHQVIFGFNVNLREGPAADAKVIEQLSYNIVKINRDESVVRKTGKGEDDWIYERMKVETLGGKKGFVKADLVRSSIDYRAGFNKKRGVWKMT